MSPLEQTYYSTPGNCKTSDSQDRHLKVGFINIIEVFKAEMNKPLTEIYENMNNEGKQSNTSKHKSVNRNYISFDFTWALLFICFLFTVLWFFLSYYIFLPLRSKLVFKWEIEVVWIWIRGEVGRKRSRVLGNHNRNIVFEKEKSIFNKRKILIVKISIIGNNG